MPISNSDIREQVNALINNTKGLEQSKAQEEFARGLANIIESALKSATVTIQPGIPVSTSGGPGTTTGSGTGSLS